MGSEYSGVTPGTDDTPYIHFAIDQLTRDEEVRGSRAYPHLPGAYPDSTDRLNTQVYDQGLGYVAAQEAQPKTLGTAFAAHQNLQLGR